MVRIIGAKLLRFFLSWLKLLCIDDKKIILFSYQGRGVNCNPKYLTKYLVREKAKKHLHINIYFAVSDKNKIAGMSSENVNFIKYGGLKFLYHMATAKVVVTNSSNLPWFPYKKNQILINTWHGGGAYKSEWYNLKLTKFKNERVDYFVSSSRVFTKLLSKSTGLAEEKFICTGMPRNDVMFNKSIQQKKELHCRYGLPLNYRYLLYAPTYRDDNTDYPYPNFGEILQAMETKFGGKWKLLVRGHYNLSGSFSDVNDCTIYRDMSEIDDMQDVLMISDAVITDYSSLIWDYSFLYRPCFLYVPDMKDYARVRGFYYPLSSWGFPYAENMSAMIKVINDFDEVDFYKSMKKHHEKMGSFEEGTASQRVGCLVLKHLRGDKK